MIRRSAMMAAPPADQHHESAGDSENGSFRHFFTHLVCMLERLVIYDLRDSDLVTRTYRACARAGSQSICSSVCRLQFISPPSSCVRLRLSGRAAVMTTPPREITTTLRIFCFGIMLFRPRMSEVITWQFRPPVRRAATTHLRDLPVPQKRGLRIPLRS